MTVTETTRSTTLRAALKAIRTDLSGRDYLSGHLEYWCDKGLLMVRNAKVDGNSYLLGVFVAELAGADGATVRKYKV